MRLEFESATWKSIEAWATARLDRARLKNDGDMDPIATAKTRGEIRTLKDLLALAKPAPAPGTDEQ